MTDLLRTGAEARTRDRDTVARPGVGARAEQLGHRSRTTLVNRLRTLRRCVAVRPST